MQTELMQNGFLKIDGFKMAVWDDFAGAAGAFVAESCDGKTEAIAEPQPNGFLCWIVSTADGSVIRSETINQKGFM